MKSIFILCLLISLWMFFCEASRNQRIHITEGDSRDLSYYKGPSNKYRTGKPLPSYIIRSKQGGDFQNSQKPFLGSEKPNWNDDEDIQLITLVS